MFGKDFTNKALRFLDAVDKNQNTPLLKPLGNQVHVQVMPKPDRVGILFRTVKDDKMGTKENGFGTVINVGPDVDDIEIGDDVVFPRKLGRRFGGMYNPLRVGRESDWTDEIRVLRSYNILALVVYNLQGKKVTIEEANGVKHEAVVKSESILYGGLLLVVLDETGEELWVKPSDICN